MANGRFILQKPNVKNRNGNWKKNPLKTRLYYYLIIDRDHVVKCKTEFTVYPKDWKQSDQKLEGPDNGPINKRLRKIDSDMITKYTQLVEKYPDISFKALSKNLKEYAKTKEIPMLDKKNKPIFEVLDIYIESLTGSYSEGSIKKAKTFKKVLGEFCKTESEYSDLSFSMIDKRFYRAYVKYLRNKEPGEKSGRQKNRPEGEFKGLLNATVGKYIESLKTFCKWAEGENYKVNKDYKEFKLTAPVDKKREQNKEGYDLKIVSLSLTEFTTLYRHDFTDFPHLARVRDLFCFLCFTGQRWSDGQAFNKNNIKDNIWIFKAQKTKKETLVPLTGFSSGAVEILERYEYQLPKMSAQKFNVYIKKAAEKVGITQEVELKRYVGNREINRVEPKYNFISSHTARRTFVSLMLNVFKQPPTIVMEITKHNDLATLKKYVDTKGDVVKEAMADTPVISKVSGPLRVAN